MTEDFLISETDAIPDNSIVRYIPFIHRFGLDIHLHVYKNFKFQIQIAYCISIQRLYSNHLVQLFGIVYDVIARYDDISRQIAVFSTQEIVSETN